ncbi:MAG: methylglyoxal synthase [Nitrospira bacterium HGW-Nitrospira-1]|nr:MAG: methylglyoxal synthase [Nitrospira bacterium HGW-Nitrospira-1]
MSEIKMRVKKRIVLVAHDNMKKELLEWALFNKNILAKHELFATGSTGRILVKALEMPVNCFKSGPLGGDQQIGAKIAEGGIDMAIFFWDPLEPQPHDVDVKALLRIAAVYNIPIACNRATADFIISSHLMNEVYERIVVDYERAQKTRNDMFAQDHELQTTL